VCGGHQAVICPAFVKNMIKKFKIPFLFNPFRVEKNKSDFSIHIESLRDCGFMPERYIGIPEGFNMNRTLFIAHAEP
jgi:hypothetical protein